MRLAQYIFLGRGPEGIILEKTKGCSWNRIISVTAAIPKANCTDPESGTGQYTICILRQSMSGMNYLVAILNYASQIIPHPVPKVVSWNNSRVEGSGTEDNLSVCSCCVWVGTVPPLRTCCSEDVWLCMYDWRSLRISIKRYLYPRSYQNVLGQPTNLIAVVSLNYIISPSRGIAVRKGTPRRCSSGCF